MIALFKNRLAYLSLSLILLIISFPLISIGSTSGVKSLWWIGLLTLACGGLIPPVQRLLFGPPKTAVAAPKTDDTQSSHLKGAKS